MTGGFIRRSRDERRYQKLLARIRASVPIEHVSVKIAGIDYPWIRVLDPDALLVQALVNGEDGDSQTDPFWAASWRAASGMDQHLGRYDIKGMPILELGGGSGRAGISAALRGANVLITDAASMALKVCDYNCKSVRDRAKVRKLDWKAPNRDLGRFPLIIGSDIVYDPKLFPILEPCVRRLLAPNGRALFSEPYRHTGDRFHHWIQSAGWCCQLHDEDLNDGERSIRIFECKLATRS